MPILKIIIMIIIMAIIHHNLYNTLAGVQNKIHLHKIHANVTVM